ncbi:MAG: transcription antitermination factor NusB [Planctomycetia bacterium]|nr:transcription antitermination factor NusB [Planctomycetia bacterium]
MANFRKARVAAFQTLYSDEMNPGQGNLDERLRESLHSNVEQMRFAHELVEGVNDYREEIDADLKSAVRNWQLDRLALTDKNILRVGIYELRYTQTPAPIVINEAIEIAKEFGAKNSGGFVNGVLDTIHKKIDAEKSVQPE